MPPQVRQAIGAVPGCAPLPRHVVADHQPLELDVATQPERCVAEVEPHADGQILSALGASARAATPRLATEPTEPASPKNISKMSEISVKPAVLGPFALPNVS